MEYKMEQIKGQVEFFGTHKFNNESYSLKLKGDDNWYFCTKKYNGVFPRKGEEVIFIRKGKVFTELKARYSHPQYFGES